MTLPGASALVVRAIALSHVMDIELSLRRTMDVWAEAPSMNWSKFMHLMVEWDERQLLFLMDNCGKKEVKRSFSRWMTKLIWSLGRLTSWPRCPE